MLLEDGNHLLNELENILTQILNIFSHVYYY